MSTQINRSVSCPHCGTEVSTEMWPGINAEVNPNLRAQVLNESLFDWTCPNCGYSAQLLYPCLYHDKGRKYMVYLVPSGNDEELEQVNVEEAFPQLHCVKKRVVTSLAALKEKILIFEAGLDDRAVELIKLALTQVLTKKSEKELQNAYFSYADKEKNRLAFSFFIKGEKNPVEKTTKIEAYQKSLEIVKQYDEQLCGFTEVDSVLAQLILEEYQAG